MSKEQRPTLNEWAQSKNYLKGAINTMYNLEIIDLISDYLEAHKEPVEEEPTTEDMFDPSIVGYKTSVDENGEVKKEKIKFEDFYERPTLYQNN